jgi:hypothetical protein
MCLDVLLIIIRYTDILDNIKMDVREIVWEGVDSIHVAQAKGPVAGSCEHSNELLGSIKGRESLD